MENIARDLPFRLDSEFIRGDVIHRRRPSWWGWFGVRERWRRVRDLGTGGFGVVWLEQMEGTGELRAVKRMTLLELASKGIDFRRELQILVSLRDHQRSFVQFLGWYRDDDFVYLAMEYATYGDLEQYLNQFGAQKEADAKEITRQLLEGLVVLQKKKICHRDLKPQNVLVASTSPIHVKLADFGVSKCYEGTILDTRWGTQGYQAPELLGLLHGRRNPGYTNAVDLWALGCLLHKILTLETPFSEQLETPDSAITGIDSPGIYSGSSIPQINMHLFCAYCSGTASLPTEILQNRVDSAGIDFVKRLLVPNPECRLSALEALDHGWMSGCSPFAYEENISRTLESQFISLGILPSPGQIDILVSELRRSRYVDIPPFLPPSNISHAILAAASKGYAFIVEILLGDKSADSFIIDTKYNSSGRTALQAASNGGHLGVVTLLLDRGADINASPANFYGRTALQAAAGAGQFDIVTLLLDNGADINAPPAMGGRTTPQAAAEVGHLDVVTLLLARGADINASPAYLFGRTALQAAAEVGHLDIVALLLDKGANINASPAYLYGRTALQAATEGGHSRVVKLLLERDTNIHTTVFLCGNQRIYVT